MDCLVRSGVGCVVRQSTVDAQLFVDNGGVIGLTAGTNITLGGTAQNPIINSVAPVLSVAGATGIITMSGTNCSITTTGQDININVPAPPPTGVQTITAGTNITLTGTAENPTINASAISGVETITAGTDIILTGTATNPIISVSNRTTTITTGTSFVMPTTSSLYLVEYLIAGGGGGGGGGISTYVGGYENTKGRGGRK